MTVDQQLLAEVIVGDALLDLADCVCAELSVSPGGATCWCGLWPGAEVSWEYCADCGNDRCGMGYVRVAAINPYDIFPDAVVDLRCAKPLAAELEVGALRCMPTPGDGEIATPPTLGDTAMIQVYDAMALRRALLCCEAEMALGAYTPVGPMGGCVGGYWSAYLAVD